MATAQREPSLVQKDLLASKLVGANSDLLKAARLELLCEIAKCQLCEVARAEELCNVARSGPGRPDRSEAKYELSEAVHIARAAQRVNAPSPLGSRGQWVSGNSESDYTALEREAVSLWTPIATVQALCAMPRAEDSEAGHLLELVRIQAVTRSKARKAVLGKDPLADETAQRLLSKITKLQSTDPLCIWIRREISIKISTKISTKSQEGTSTENSREGYLLDQTGLLWYKGRVIVPAQKALTQELLYLYHDNQFAGHWGIEKTKELLEWKFYWPGLAKDI
jgi:hypothetical protein